MFAKSWRMGSFISSSSLLFCVGCTVLSTDPLSPPHLRRASCTAQHELAEAEDKLSPEYQEWLEEVRHFWGDTTSEFAAEYHKNDEWPYPYSDLAEQTTRQPLMLQAENARFQMLTVWDYHFEPGTGKLNTMGRKRIQDIVDQTGSLGHTIYIRRAQNPKETTARLAEVRTLLEQSTEGQITFELVEISASPSGVSGNEAQKAMQLLTTPSKNTTTGTSNTSSGTSASGGGQ